MGLLRLSGFTFTGYQYSSIITSKKGVASYGKSTFKQPRSPTTKI